jgi:hypothetical protein
MHLNRCCCVAANSQEDGAWNPTFRKGRETWGTRSKINIKVKGSGQECPLHTSNRRSCANG